MDKIDGCNNEFSFMVSEIKNENQLRMTIDNLKNKIDNNKSPNKKENNIIIHFDQANSNKIQFISNFINKTYIEDNNCIFIFIIHITRHFIHENYNRIYYIPNIYPHINQLFIDNLKGKKIKLNEIMGKKVKDILDDKELINLEKVFPNALTSFIYERMNENNNKIILDNSSNKDNILNKENYIAEIIKYMEEDTDFKKKIIDKVKELIQKEYNVEECRSLVDKTLNNMDKNSIDFINSFLEYIINILFSKNLKHIFEVLEYNNLLTTLIEIKKNKNKEIEVKLDYLKTKFLNSIKFDNKTYEPKFKFNHIIPGLYNFYKSLSYYINNNIAIKLFKKEKKLRKYSGNNKEEVAYDHTLHRRCRIHRQPHLRRAFKRGIRCSCSRQPFKLVSRSA